MDFSQNYFKLFGLSKEYVLDKKRLLENYKKLQQQFHPDRFAASSANEQRMALQFTAYINTAFETLKSPVLRAEYLLLDDDIVIDKESSTIADGEFLMLQMEWRESLADMSANDSFADAEQQLERLLDDVQEKFASLQSVIEKQFEDKNFDEIKQNIARLQFVEKMLTEIDSLESSLFD